MSSEDKMGLRNKAHDLIINSKTKEGIKAVCIMMKVKILTPLPRCHLTHSSFYLLHRRETTFLTDMSHMVPEV